MLREIGNTLDGVENENLSKEVCRREEGLARNSNMRKVASAILAKWRMGRRDPYDPLLALILV